MHLAPASFDSQLIKGEILHYSKGLISSIKMIMLRYSNLFMVSPREMKTLSITPCNLEIQSTGKDPSRRTLTGETPIRYC